MNNLIIKFLLQISNFILLVLIIICMVGYFFYGETSNCYFALILTVLLLVGNLINWYKQSLIGCIVTCYVMYVGPISSLLTLTMPYELKLVDFNQFYDIWLFQDERVLFQYFLQVVIFYTISMLTVLFFKKNCKISISINLPKILRVDNPFFIAIIFAILEFYIRTIFHLNIPGQAPLIPFAGIIVYSFQAINNYLIYITLIDKIPRKSALIYFVRVGLVLIATLMPSILIGQRGPIIYTILVVIFYILLDFSNIFPKFKITSIQITKIMISALVILLIGVGFATYYRTGKMNPIGFLMKRIIGIYDGSIAIYHSQNIGIDSMGMGDLLKKLVLDEGLSPNQYYTHIILGFPFTALHSSALPIFIGAWFYNGYVGLLVVTILFTFILLESEEHIKTYLNYRQINYRDISIPSILLNIQIIVQVFENSYVDGNFLNWKLYTPTLLTFLLLKATKIDLPEDDI